MISPVPAPDPELLETHHEGRGIIVPANDLEAWVWSNILSDDGPLSNYDFEALREHRPRVGFLWCTEVEMRKGRRTLGTCALGRPTGRVWEQIRRTEQLLRWFGEVPAFVITLDALFASHALQTDRPADLLAVVEHELYHCGQELDRYGAVRFTPDDTPVWTVAPHDVEEFAGVVRRYGVAASAAGPLAAAIEHVREHGPDVAEASLDGLCGTCGRAVAHA